MRGLATNKGRDTQLIGYRNEKLAARFYYYSCILGLRYSRCLENMIPEFDLSESRIRDLISEHAELINRLELQGVGIAELKQAYPFMTWSPLASNRRNNAKQLSLDLFSN
ncbi:hypothetical protein EJN86_11105 [Riemerella anatipestifer]|nr:hypothetical protein [Riemerella anatipestifer]NAV17351.1 hypothetical protein [Riemerella anatipestifer]